MKASVVGWKLYNKEHEYPVLQLYCSASELEETKALQGLHKICEGLIGLGFNRKVASISNPDALKEQGTWFSIDLGTLLTLCCQIVDDKAKKEFTLSWLRSLAATYQSSNIKKADDLLCRCGKLCKSEKKLTAHKKKCLTIARDLGLMLRVTESLKGIKDNGKEKSKSKRIRKDTKTTQLPPKISSKQKKGTKRKKVHN